MPKKTQKVIQKWREFVEAYIANGRNGRMAYKAIYETKTKKIKDTSADSEAWKLLSRPEVRKYFKRRLKAIAKKTDVTVSDLVGSLQDIVETTRNEETRIKATQQISKLLGLEAPIRIDQQNLNIDSDTLSADEKKQIRAYIREKK